MFIKNSNGYINLDAVARGSLGQIERGRSIPTGYFSPTGAEIDRVGELPDLEKMTAPLVPASGAATLAVSLRVDPTDQRPTAVHTETAAVVAWRVTRHGAEPVYIGPEPSGLMFVGVGAGKLLETATGRLHNDIDQARDAVLQAAQREWDTAHPDQAPVEVEIEPTPVEQPKVAVAGRRRG
jgi:hypothetical protein